MTPQVLAAKNVGSSWLKLALQLAVGFALSPFILHKLGDTAFGIWVLIFSLTGYYGLFDFGILMSIGRYVARFAATGDREQLNRFVNTSLAALSILGLLILLLTLIGSHYLGMLFKIPTEYLATARLLFLLVGADVAMGFPLSVFGCVLEGYQNFWSLNITHIASTVMRGALILVALSLGGGLLTLAIIAVGLNLLRHLACVVIVFRTTPVRLAAQYLNRTDLGELAGYSLVSFVLTLAESLRFQSDAIVIGAFLSTAAITFYVIGSKLAEYPASLVVSLAQIFTPMASQYEATGNVDGLRKVFVGGNRACALVILPLSAALMILGQRIIQCWMGPKYLSSYLILLVLIVPKTLFLAQSSSMRILLGLGRLRVLTFVVLADGVANLILSIVLLRYWGILGVALGTGIPLLCTSVFFLPRHLCRMLGVPLGDFLREAYLAPIGVTIPMVGVLLLLRQLLPTTTWGTLLLQVGAGGAIYVASLICWMLLNRSLDIQGFPYPARFLSHL